MPKNENETQDLTESSKGDCSDVWCRLTLRSWDTRSTRCSPDSVITLWVKTKISHVIPIGSIVYLPTPKAWDDATGSFWGKVDNWESINGKLICVLTMIDNVDRDGAAELTGTGLYFEAAPKEVYDAERGLII